MGRSVRARAPGLGLLAALSACAGPPGDGVPASATARAGPARCPAPGADELRAEPVRSPFRALRAGEGHGTLDLLAVSGDGVVWATRSVQRVTAAGMETTSGGLSRWDGDRRQAYALPSGMRVAALGALSGARAWVFGSGGDGRPGLVAGVADGAVTTSAVPEDGAASIGLYGTAARGPWAVSGRDALRWDGSGWRAYRLPAPARALGGEGADLWTVGATPSEPAARWDGTAWQAVPLPEPGAPAGARSPRTRLGDVAVLGPDDVWVVGGVSWLPPGEYDEQGEPLERRRPLALHWDGSSWRCLWGPEGAAFTEAEPDGRAGMWVLDSTRSRLHHYAAGRWTTTNVAGTVTALAHRPGSAEVYAAGWTGREGGPTTPALWRTP
ncbi:hypothetical protein DMB42_16450 [Nonomuraea sp. WAC 01424]|uniref:hypothetical protein n=1 Tax=Nonomuraea sp. WAC 01424 TaxID=2203200 RepID=UPI000F7B3CC8|nr:hypothetical protein [Nonomuraea sp. WAC 01424]RSN10493.1 hypothetical protein DMB42_16450 [Nonomuraea sp. WAC 01424]